MGSHISNLIKNTSSKNKQPDADEILEDTTYQEKTDEGNGYSDELEKRKIKWWERIIFDKRLRITYVFILGLILGFVIPMILFMTKLETKNRAIYGSCLINNNARFECLSNSPKPADEDSCTKAMCCWENSDTLPFKCYHSLPSAYHYSVTNIQTDFFNDTEWTSIKMKPSLKKSGLANLITHIHWESQTHLVVEVFNPEAFPTRDDDVRGRRSSLLEKSRSRKKNAVGEEEQQRLLDDDDRPFNVTWSGDGEFFYVKIVRNNNNNGDTIFDTRLGPVLAGDNYISLSTVLQSPYFYGLRGGQGSLSTLTYATVNGFENIELPFYISYEQHSGMWHGVLIDTNEPMLTQVVQAPGIMFHLETDSPEMNFNFFAGPDQAGVVRQLHAHIQRKYKITHPPMIPPYWGLGLHLCRRVENGSVVLDHLRELTMMMRELPYDSDCIDEYLRHPTDIDQRMLEYLEDIKQLLLEKNKKIVLSQKVTEPVGVSENNGGVWLLDSNSTRNNMTHFLGQVDNITVKYMDFFNPRFGEFPVFPPKLLVVVSGVSLDDNFPKMYNASLQCGTPESRIQSWFSGDNKSSSNTVNSSLIWGSVCPNTFHTVRDNNTSIQVQHKRFHNTYGERSLIATARKLNSSRTAADVLITSSSIWITSLYYGAFNGMQVPFTWQGLQDSVSHTVRKFALAPISGTPICGSVVFNLSIPYSEDLCLRWFQFGLLLPISRNLYDDDGNSSSSSYGPLNLSTQYRGYLTTAIRTRYTFAPYYYSTLYEYQTKYTPFIRPMSFHFNEANVLPLLNQFMIGEAILAAPVIDRELTRSAYFPPGVWYTKEGLTVWDNTNSGCFQQITGYISETPMFIRGGYTLPTLENSANSIEETLQGNYSLLVALSSLSNPGHSHGTLTVKENNNEADNNNFHYHLNFHSTFSPTNKTFTMSINSTTACKMMNTENSISTVIDQVRILALPLDGDLIVTVNKKNAEEDYTHTGRVSKYGDHGSVLLYDLNMDWCGDDGTTTTEFEIIVKH